MKRGAMKCLGFSMVATFLLSGVAAQLAEAKGAASIMPPSTKRGFALFGIGPAIEVSDAQTQFKLTQEVGWHLFGPTGLAVGGALHESVGSGVFGLQMGPKAWWDFQPIPGVAFYATPFMQMGWAMAAAGGATQHYFNVNFGAEARAVFADQWMLFVRMLSIDIAAGNTVPVRWDMQFGGGITF